MDIAGHKTAVKIIEALGIPKEKNIAWFRIEADWSKGPLLTVQYKYYPKPAKMNEDGGIVSVLKKCKLVEMEEEE